MTPEEVAPGCHPTISHVMHGPMQKIQILFPDTLMEMPRHRVRRWVRFMRQHPEYGPGYFAAFVIDSDDYRIEAVMCGE